MHAELDDGLVDPDRRLHAKRRAQRIVHVRAQITEPGAHRFGRERPIAEHDLGSHALRIEGFPARQRHAEFDVQRCAECHRSDRRLERDRVRRRRRQREQTAQHDCVRRSSRSPMEGHAGRRFGIRLSTTLAWRPPETAHAPEPPACMQKSVTVGAEPESPNNAAGRTNRRRPAARNATVKHGFAPAPTA
ncbi:MAG: hypothetical protein KDF63_10225 [Rhodoferax sp.]|nr:hypothetical protein [Rhodoferax sp.]MCP5288982.1 hypothetical protein [Burkholderiaceae bacterium]